MTDATAIQAQLERCDAWLRENANNTAITSRAADSVKALQRRLQHDLNHAKP